MFVSLTKLSKFLTDRNYIANNRIIFNIVFFISNVLDFNCSISNYFALSKKIVNCIF